MTRITLTIDGPDAREAIAELRSSIDYASLDAEVTIVTTDETPEPVYLNVYEVDRAYGGPEEGGWWYDTGTLIKSLWLQPDSPEHIERMKLDLLDTLDIDPGDRDYRVCVEDEPGADYPARRPHYE